jgi:Zn-dependent protease
VDIVKVAGIPIRLHWSFLVLMALYAVGALVTRGLLGLSTTLGLAVVLFTSVVLHELGHAMAARMFGIRTAHITLYPFGGVAAIAGMPAKPWQEMVVALAGPAVNAALAVLFLGGWAISGALPLLFVAALNVGMGMFNLIPAFPMDGGRVLRAALAGPMGYVPGTRTAIAIGRLFAWLFIGMGVAWWQPGLLMVGMFLHLALGAESRRLEAMVRRAWRPMIASPPPYVARWTLSPRG